jgi:hypothetical protein
MSRRRTDDPTPDLFSPEHVGQRSRDQISADVTVTQKSTGRLILPRDLRKAITYLDDRELQRLFDAVVEEVRRRGLPARFDPEQAKWGRAAKPSPSQARTERLSPGHASTTAQLTSGQVKAVRAAFRAGITPLRIARQFGLSQADVRKALTSVHSNK